MSRPKKQRNARLSRQIAVRFTEDEYAELLEIAERAGVRPSELARMLIRKRRGKIALEAVASACPVLLKRLDRIGWNLNQLVKNAHIFKRVSPNIDKLCGEIRQIIDTAVEREAAE